MSEHPGNDDNQESSTHAADELSEAKSALKAAEEAFEVSWKVSEQLLIVGLREHELVHQLRRQLAFYHALADSLGEGIYAVNLAGRITFVNPVAEHLLGQTEAELLGRDAYSTLHNHNSDTPPMLVPPSPLIAVMRDGTSYRTQEALFNRRGESVFPVAYLASPIISDEQIMGAVVSFRDITEMQRLQRARDETMVLLSHDLRTPLTTILGYAKYLHDHMEQQGLTKEARWANILVTSGQRMNSMIEEVLDRNFREAGDDAQTQVVVNLVELCQRMIAQVANSTEAGRIHLHAIESPPIVANPIQIERVVINLLGNALKYSTAGSPIVIRVSHDDQYAVVAIADEGIGIDERDLAQLFEKFYRTRTVGAIEGRGLGLYGSRLIVESYGGRIWAESELGVGSTFIFMLPLSGS
ncbi:MAG: PAS domain S-box protein [Ardenticatenales bacterium]|nr:PAS domain S-box protein [Ardenticatenales bacterium]